MTKGPRSRGTPVAFRPPDPARCPLLRRHPPQVRARPRRRPEPRPQPQPPARARPQAPPGPPGPSSRARAAPSAARPPARRDPRGELGLLQMPRRRIELLHSRQHPEQLRLGMRRQEGRVRGPVFGEVRAGRARRSPQPRRGPRGGSKWCAPPADWTIDPPSGRPGGRAVGRAAGSPRSRSGAGRRRDSRPGPGPQAAGAPSPSSAGIGSRPDQPYPTAVSASALCSRPSKPCRASCLNSCAMSAVRAAAG